MQRLSLQTVVFSIALLLLAGISYWFFLSPDDASVESASPVVEEFMSKVQAKRYDKTGHLHQMIVMAKWEHFKGDTVTSMQTPSLTLYYPDGKICHISSDEGEGFHANLKGPLEKLHLFKNVVIQQLGERPQAWWELKTPSILYFPGSQTAMTDEWVTVISPSATIQSQGMKIYLDKQRVEFMSQVKSQYAKSI